MINIIGVIICWLGVGVQVYLYRRAEKIRAETKELVAKMGEHSTNANELLNETQYWLNTTFYKDSDSDSGKYASDDGKVGRYVIDDEGDITESEEWKNAYAKLVEKTLRDLKK